MLARLALVLLEAAGGRLQHRPQNGARVADQSQIDVAVLADRAIVHIDLHQLRLGADSPPVAHAKVERRADNDNDVGVGESVAAGSIEVVRIARRQQAAAAAVEVAGDVKSAQQRDRFLMAPRRPHLLSVEDGRTL